MLARVVVKSQEADVVGPGAGGRGNHDKLNMVMQRRSCSSTATAIHAQVELAKTELIDRGNDIEVMVDLKCNGTPRTWDALLHGYDRTSAGRHGSAPWAVYRDLRRIMIVAVDPEKNFKRPFRVDINVTSKGRNDIAAEDMLFGNEVTHSVAVK